MPRNHRITTLITAVMIGTLATACGGLKAGSKNANSSKLDLDIALEEISSNGCLNIQKLIERLRAFPETVLMKEYTKDFEITGSSPGRNIELYLAKSSFIFRFLQASEFAAEFTDFRQSNCDTVTEVDPFIAPIITPEDDPNSDPEETGGGGGGDPVPHEGRIAETLRDDAPSGHEPFTVDGYSPSHLRISRPDGSAYEFRWIDKGTIEVSFGYKAEMFRCGREYHTPVRHTRVYRWSGQKTNASVDEEIASKYLKDLVDASDNSVSFGFSATSSSSSDGATTLTADDLFRLASAPADSSLYRCR